MSNRQTANASKEFVLSQNYINPIRNTQQTKDYYFQLNEYIERTRENGLRQFLNFSKYVPRQALTGFLARYELFKLVLDVPGSIIECGVFHGQGLMSFAQFSAILEPVHYLRGCGGKVAPPDVLSRGQPV